MAGAPEGQSWPAPGGESAIGERQSSALRVGIDGGSWVVHPARITVTSNATKHPSLPRKLLSAAKSIKPETLTSCGKNCSSPKRTSRCTLAI